MPAKRGKDWDMKRLLVISLGLMSLFIARAGAEDTNPPVSHPAVFKTDKIHKLNAELIIVGIIRKSELRQNGETVVNGFKLIAENGNEYTLRVPDNKSSTGVDLADFDGMKVKVVGKGVEGRESAITIITSIEKVNPTPANPSTK
jgi:hypothetical protein